MCKQTSLFLNKTQYIIFLPTTLHKKKTFKRFRNNEILNIWALARSILRMRVVHVKRNSRL